MVNGTKHLYLATLCKRAHSNSVYMYIIHVMYICIYKIYKMCSALSIVELSQEKEALLSPKMTTIIIPASVAFVLLLIIAVSLVLVIVVRRRYSRLKRSHVIATTPFGNASPQLERQKDKGVGVRNDVFEANGNTSHTSLSVLDVPPVLGTPPSLEVTTFQTSPPSTTLPPSYSDLDNHTQSDINNHVGFTNQCSNCSPPEENGIVGDELCVKDSTEYGGQAPLSVQYSLEPRAAGGSPPPQSRTDSTEWRREGE